MIYKLRTEYILDSILSTVYLGFVRNKDKNIIKTVTSFLKSTKYSSILAMNLVSGKKSLKSALVNFSRKPGICQTCGP